MLYGSLIDILNRSTEITLIALGMTLVIATAGTDLSVGATVAVSGALALKMMRWDMSMYPTAGDFSITPFALVIAAGLLAGILMGSFNGLLVSRFGMQPIITTLILMVAGRGIAQVITNGRQMTISYTPFKFISQGSVLFLPMPVVITAVVLVLMLLFTRKTSFGMFVETVGINRSASRVSGINAKRVLMMVYIITGFLAALSGIIYASRNRAKRQQQRRAQLRTGRDSGCGYRRHEHVGRQVQPAWHADGIHHYPYDYYVRLLFRRRAAEATMLFKALIVAVVIILQSEPVRRAIGKRTKRRKLAVEKG